MSNISDSANSILAQHQSAWMSYVRMGYSLADAKELAAREVSVKEDLAKAPDPKPGKLRKAPRNNEFKLAVRRQQKKYEERAAQYQAKRDEEARERKNAYERERRRRIRAATAKSEPSWLQSIQDPEIVAAYKLAGSFDKLGIEFGVSGKALRLWIKAGYSFEQMKKRAAHLRNTGFLPRLPVAAIKKLNGKKVLFASTVLELFCVSRWKLNGLIKNYGFPKPSHCEFDKKLLVWNGDEIRAWCKEMKLL